MDNMNLKSTIDVLRQMRKEYEDEDPNSQVSKLLNKFSKYLEDEENIYVKTYMDMGDVKCLSKDGEQISPTINVMNELEAPVKKALPILSFASLMHVL